MTDQHDSVATWLWLGAKRYFLIIAIPALLAGVLAYAAIDSSSDVQYEATSVVVASDLKIRPEGLPRFAESVFNGGEVARAAAQNLPYEASGLIPDRARLEPFENTVVLEVVGTDPNPATAAQIANGVAEAFVVELNQPGPTLGTFVVQSRAQAPIDPVAPTGDVVAVLVGVVAGLSLGTGLLLLLLVVRRPVLTVADATRAANAPLLANLVLPRRRDLAIQPPVRTAALARRLFPTRSGMAALLAPPRSAAARRQVAASIARVLARGGPVHLVTELEGDASRDLATRGLTVDAEVPSGRVWAGAPVLIDGPSEYDLPALYPPNARLALVVQAGTPAKAVSAIAEEFLPGELFGVILVERRARESRRTLGNSLSTRSSVKGPDDLLPSSGGQADGAHTSGDHHDNETVAGARSQTSR